MHDSINFLRERVRVQEAELQGDKRMMVFTTIGLGLFVVMVVGISAYNYYLTTKFTALQASVDQVKTQLATFDDVQQAYGQRKSMLTLASQVIEKRTKAWDAISYLYSVIPQESHIDSINLSGTDGSLQFSVKAPDIFAYKNLSSVLQSDAVKQGGYSPQLGTLTRGPDGGYILQVQLLSTQGGQTASPSATL